MPAKVEIYSDAGTMQFSETTPSLVLQQKIRIDQEPTIWPGDNPGQAWKYADMYVDAVAPMVAFLGDPYAFFPQVTEVSPGRFRMRLWINTPSRIQGWAYVFDRPRPQDAKYLSLYDAQGRLTYTLGAKPMRIVGTGLVAPNGFVEETIPEFQAGRVYAGVMCAPATSTYPRSFTVMGIGTGSGWNGRVGLFGQPVGIPKIGDGGSPNQAVVGRVICVDVTGY